MHIYLSCCYCRNVYKDLDTDWNWSNAVRGQLSAAEPDTKISVACTPLRCIDLFWLFRAVCYQVPEWIIVCVHVHGHAHTHECFWRSITPLMVISERAVLLTAYWISSPMKEQRWYKKDLQVGVFVCVSVCIVYAALVCPHSLVLTEARGLCFIVAVRWPLQGLI